MMQQANNTAEAISGRATGVLFFAGFGSLWLYNGLSAMHRANLTTDAAIGTICAALAVPAVLLLRSVSKVSEPAGASDNSLQVKRLFARTNTIQWVAIVAAVALFNLLQKQEFLPPVITFIVGVHLFPLARVFRYPVHNVTGTLLVLWAMAIVILLPGRSMPSVGAIGTASVLLLSAAYTLSSASRAARSSAFTMLSHARA